MHVFIKDKGVHGGKKHVTQYAPKKKIQYIYIYIYYHFHPASASVQNVCFIVPPLVSRCMSHYSASGLGSTLWCAISAFVDNTVLCPVVIMIAWETIQI